MAAAGLAAVSATKVIGRGEDHVWALVVELVGLGDWSYAEFVAVIRRR